MSSRGSAPGAQLNATRVSPRRLLELDRRSRRAAPASASRAATAPLNADAHDGRAGELRRAAPRRALGHDAPAVDDEDAVADRLDLRQDVGREEDRAVPRRARGSSRGS